MIEPNEVIVGNKLDANWRKMYFVRKDGKLRRIAASYALALIGRGIPAVDKGN